MGSQDWIALCLAGAAMFFAVRWVRKSLRGDSGCRCSSGKPCHPVPTSAGHIHKAMIKPLVQLHTPPTDQSSDESLG